jgi:hypothetical protein
MDVYPALRYLTHSERGLDEHEMTWFFKRCIPLSSIKYARQNTPDNLTAILEMIQDGGHATSVKHMDLIWCGEKFDAFHCGLILTMYTGLESLDVSRWGAGCIGVYHPLSEACFSALGQGCPSLTNIDLSRCRGISEAAMITLTEGCPDLTTVNLRRSDVDSAAIIARAARSHSLTSLDLFNCVVTDAALTAVAQGCPRLTKLVLWNELRVSITDVSVIALADGCPLLTYLDLNNCAISDAAVVALACRCRSLIHLDLGWCNITDTAVTALIQHSASLTALNLAHTDVTDASILAIANGGLPSLERLDITKQLRNDYADNVIISAQASEELARKRPLIFQKEWR